MHVNLLLFCGRYKFTCEILSNIIHVLLQAFWSNTWHLPYWQCSKRWIDLYHLKTNSYTKFQVKTQRTTMNSPENREDRITEWHAEETFRSCFNSRGLKIEMMCMPYSPGGRKVRWPVLPAHLLSPVSPIHSQQNHYNIIWYTLQNQ